MHDDDPQEIADHLVSEHGLDAALTVIEDGKTEANQSGDYYALSVWREVNVIVRSRLQDRHGQKDELRPMATKSVAEEADQLSNDEVQRADAVD